MLNEIHLCEGFTCKPCLTSTRPSNSPSRIFLGLSFQRHFLPAQPGLPSPLRNSRQLNRPLELIHMCRQERYPIISLTVSQNS